MKNQQPKDKGFHVSVVTVDEIGLENFTRKVQELRNDGVT